MDPCLIFHAQMKSFFHPLLSTMMFPEVMDLRLHQFAVHFAQPKQRLGTPERQCTTSLMALTESLRALLHQSDLVDVFYEPKLILAVGFVPKCGIGAVQPHMYLELRTGRGCADLPVQTSKHFIVQTIRPKRRHRHTDRSSTLGL